MLHRTQESITHIIQCAHALDHRPRPLRFLCSTATALYMHALFVDSLISTNASMTPI